MSRARMHLRAPRALLGCGHMTLSEGGTKGTLPNRAPEPPAAHPGPAGVSCAPTESCGTLGPPQGFRVVASGIPRTPRGTRERTRSGAHAAPTPALAFPGPRLQRACSRRSRGHVDGRTIAMRARKVKTREGRSCCLAGVEQTCFSLTPERIRIQSFGHLTESPSARPAGRKGK